MGKNNALFKFFNSYSCENTFYFIGVTSVADPSPQGPDNYSMYILTLVVWRSVACFELDIFTLALMQSLIEQFVVECEAQGTIKQTSLGRLAERGLFYYFTVLFRLYYNSFPL